MRSGLVSLALLGSPVGLNGCFLRGSPDTRQQRETRQHGGRVERDLVAQIEADMLAAAADGGLSIRERRVLGKRALKQACSDNAAFAECHQENGSALDLELCLQQPLQTEGGRGRGGVAARPKKVSPGCHEGLQTWKKLLSETAPGYRKELRGKKMLDRAAHSTLVLAFEDAGGEARSHNILQGLPAGVSGEEEDPFAQVERDFFLSPHHGGGKAGRHGASPSGHHHNNHHHHHHPHHHHHDGPPSHHGKGFHHHGPPGRFEPAGTHQQEVGSGGSLFSVLADWIFGDSSSSDSLDSSSDDSSDSSDPASSASPGDVRDRLGGVSDDEMITYEFVEAGEDAGDPYADLNGDPSRPYYHHHMKKKSGPVNPEGIRGGWAPYIFETLDDVDSAPPPPPKTLHIQLDSEVKWEPDPRAFDNVVDVGEEPAAHHHHHHNHREHHRPERPEHVIILGGVPPAVHRNQHHHHHHPGGDHIRFRNRLPEDYYEKGGAWFEDSFFADEDGPDLVEGILALFFFIGAFTLLMLPFFLLGRALKKMVREARGGGEDGDGGDAPDGYRALSGEESVVVGGGGIGGIGGDNGDGDDYAIVVTGTPVNPPPSVHL